MVLLKWEINCNSYQWSQHKSFEEHAKPVFCVFHLIRVSQKSLYPNHRGITQANFFEALAMITFYDSSCISTPLSSSWNLLVRWHPEHAAVTQLISLYFASQDWRATSGHGGLNMSGQDGPRSSRSRPSTDGVKRVWKRCAPPPSCLTRTRPTSLYKPATSCRSCSTPKSTHRLMCFRIPIRPKEVARKAIGTMAPWRTSEGVVPSIN